MDVRRVVGGVGRALIAAGVLILLFVAYQLWGTGLAEARNQSRLTKQFRQGLDQRPERPVPPAAGAPEEAPAPPPAPAGEAVAIIQIPKIGVEKAVVEGVGLSDLKKGPGHYPTTPMPGEPGNAAIAAHRTTYGAPFFKLDELSAGDPVLVTTHQGRFRYEVTESKVVSPKETSVLQSTGDNRLTLTTCNPRFSAAQRLIVVAALKGEALDAPPPAPEPAPASLEESEAPGLSGRNAANGPAILWGLLAAVVWLLTWLVGRVWRKWPAYLLGTPVFLVVLFVFFENFSRLLPSNF
ncbi:MAG: class E sortase [Actinomycetota bacterium]|nr:class E sortase [Actinomycetota bacterium]PLS74868.1 MAG: class E sortase [Actinomycetota bacterium]